MKLAQGPSLIEFTGERFVSGPNEGEIELEHVHRYLAAAPVCSGRVVLDAACGEGYGSHILSQLATEVVAVDFDESSLEAARLRYSGSNIKFVQGDVSSLPWSESVFDVIVSFETIEHIERQSECLDEFARLLKPGGVLVISTPEKNIYNASLSEPNSYHTHELTRSEFVDALKERFRKVRLFGQRVVYGSLLVDGRTAGDALSAFRRDKSGVVRVADAFDASMYLIATCSDHNAPELQPGLYEGAVPQNAMSSLLGGIAERDTKIRALTAEVAAAGEPEREAAARSLGRDLEQASAALERQRSEFEVEARRFARLEAGLRAEIEDGARRLATASAQEGAAIEEIGRLRSSLDEQKVGFEARVREIDELRAALAAAEQREAALSKRIEALEADVALERSARVQALGAAAAHAEAAGRSAEEIGRLTTAIHVERGEVELLSQRLRELRTDIAGSERRMAEAAARERDLSSMLRVEREARAQATTAVQVYNETAQRDALRVRRLRSGLLTARSQIEELKRELSSVLSEKVEIETRAGSHRDEIETLKAARTSAGENADRLATTLDSERKRAAAQAEELGRARDRLFALGSELRSANEEKGVALGQLEDVRTLLAAERQLVAQLTPALSGTERVAAPHVDPELRDRQPWAVAADPTVAAGGLGAYDVRPDDAVPREGLKGSAFLERFRLLSPTPDWAGAVEELNGLPPGRALNRAGEGEAPSASIVVPVYGQLAYTLNCLDALLRHESQLSFEIIVADDCSQDDSGVWLPRLEGIRYTRSDENRGFIDTCNAAGALALGSYIVLLNNDTRVVEGWLDELIGSFKLFPAAGAVGSKLFYPDGSLQEAGGILWRGGSAWNYGRDDDPNRPQYCYARQVDYVSGAAIAVPTPLWRSLGGFDTHFRPAYCEDSDLFFRVRAAGYETWYQPLAQVIHYEGKTSGTDIRQGAKAYQAINQVKLLERWRASLEEHRPDGERPWLERDRGVRGRVLVVDATTPTPDQDAGSVTTVKIIEVFQSMGYKVVFAPQDNLLYQDRYSRPLQRRGVECLYLPYTPGMEAHLAAFGSDYDVIHVFRFNVLAKTVGLLRKYCPKAKIIFNNMDLHYLRTERQALVEGSVDKLAEAALTKPREFSVMSGADVVCVPSRTEEALLLSEGLPRPVITMPYMVDLPGPRLALEERKDVVFLGGYNHAPNIDAAEWLVGRIWPKIASRLLDAKLVLAGANPPAAITDLASERVIVPGRVDSLEAVLEPSRILVAPLRYGAGVKGKIYTALAHGLPVVTTPIGIEGMDAGHEAFCLTAEDEDSFADQVVALYADEARWRRMSQAGLEFIRDRHTVSAGVQAMEQALALAAADFRPHRLSTSEDVVSIYLLALGRRPESDAVIAEKLGLEPAALAQTIFLSGEFKDAVVTPLCAGAHLSAPIFASFPSRNLCFWASNFLPLSKSNQLAVRRSKSFPALMYRLVTDPEFRSSVLSEGGEVSGPVFVNALAHVVAQEPPAEFDISHGLLHERTKSDALIDQLRKCELTLHQQASEAAALLRQREEITSSTSWRVTAPIRSLRSTLTRR